MYIIIDESNKILCEYVEYIEGTYFYTGKIGTITEIEEQEEIPCGIDPKDGSTIYQKRQSIVVSKRVVSEPEKLMDGFEYDFRVRRDKILENIVDFYQKPLVWENLTQEQQDNVRKYRQDLLNAPENNFTMPDDLVI